MHGMLGVSCKLPSSRPLGGVPFCTHVMYKVYTLLFLSRRLTHSMSLSVSYMLCHFLSCLQAWCREKGYSDDPNDFNEAMAVEFVEDYALQNKVIHCLHCLNI